MQIVIHTRVGTFLVQPEKESDLIAWLQENAVKAGQVREQINDTEYTGRQLINETYKGEF